MEGVAIFLAKARESLAGAESEFVNSRFNNCTNRCYYACLQAAPAALEKAGVKPTEPRLAFGHGFIQAHFVGELIGKKVGRFSLLRKIPIEKLLRRPPGCATRLKGDRYARTGLRLSQLQSMKALSMGLRWPERRWCTMQLVQHIAYRSQRN